MLHVIFAHDEAFTQAGHGAAHFLAAGGWIFEVARHGILDILAAAQQPQNNKRPVMAVTKVGIRDHPGAAVVTCVVHLLLNDDDGGGGIPRAWTTRLSPPVARQLPRRVTCLAPATDFPLLKRGPHFRRYGAASEFDQQNRPGATDRNRDGNSQAVVKMPSASLALDMLDAKAARPAAPAP